MSIVLIIFWFDVLAAFICAATERFFLWFMRDVC